MSSRGGGGGRGGGFRSPSPGVKAGTGGNLSGGGGSPPALPADNGVVTPASNLFGWGSIIHRNVSDSTYQTHAGWGFIGARANIGYLQAYGGITAWKGSSAVADSGTGSYATQRCFEGIATVGTGNSDGNSSTSGLGMMLSRESGTLQKAYLSCYLTASSHPATGLFGDMADTSLRNDVTTKLGQLAAFVNFMGGDGLALDLETGTWDNPSGTTQAQNLINLEQFGYEFALALWGVNPALELVIYNLQPNNSWHEVVTSGLVSGVVNNSGRTNAELSRVQFMFGVFRGYAALGATGRIRWIDHFWYRGLSNVSGVSLVTALKWNTQGTLAGLSTDLPTASWNAIAPKFDVTPFSWAGTDNGTFYNNTQESEPTWTNNQETYRQWGMGGWRCEYTQDQGFPGGNAQYGLYAGNNNYSFPSGRIAGMQAATSTDASFATDTPVISSVTGSGTNPTLAFTASHSRGIRCITYKVYAGSTLTNSGTFQMTFDLNGGSATSGITGSRMSVNQQITAPSGSQVQITAYSTMALPPTGAQHSVAVNV